MNRTPTELLGCEWRAPLGISPYRSGIVEFFPSSLPLRGSRFDLADGFFRDMKLEIDFIPLTIILRDEMASVNG